MQNCSNEQCSYECIFNVCLLDKDCTNKHFPKENLFNGEVSNKYSSNVLYFYKSKPHEYDHICHTYKKYFFIGNTFRNIKFTKSISNGKKLNRYKTNIDNYSFRKDRWSKQNKNILYYNKQRFDIRSKVRHQIKKCQNKIYCNKYYHNGYRDMNYRKYVLDKLLINVSNIEYGDICVYSSGENRWDKLNKHIYINDKIRNDMRVISSTTANYQR